LHNNNNKKNMKNMYAIAFALVAMLASARANLRGAEPRELRKRTPLTADDPRWTAPRADGRCGGGKWGWASCDPESATPCCNYHKKTRRCGATRKFCNGVGHRAWGVDFRTRTTDIAPVTPAPTPKPTPKPTPRPTPKPTPGKPTPAPTPEPTAEQPTGLRPLDALHAHNVAKFAKGSTIPLAVKAPAGLNLARACCADATVTRTVRWSEWTEGLDAVEQGEVVTVPCGTHVILDAAPEGDLKGLRIEGKLSALNDARFEAEVRTGYVYNCGSLEVGTADNLFAGKLTFTLVGAEELKGFGYKAFATEGGLTRLHGSMCGATTWTTLAATAAKGSDRLTLAEPVAWGLGDEVVVASTGYSEDETERHTLVALEDGGRTAVLSGALKHAHGGRAPITAEVMSLTRNIVIRGEWSCTQPNNALSTEAGKCGHFVIAQTAGAHKVCGVEVTRMGQALETGRYPMHMHLIGSAPELEIRSNAIHDNFQRGVVIHATSDIRVEENIILKSRGHLLMTEDSLEEGNQIVRNVLGMTTFRDRKKTMAAGGRNSKCAFLTDASRSPLRKLNRAAGEWGTCEWHRCSHGTGVYADVCGFRHDDYIGTAAIWLSNPNNSLIGNRLFVSKVDAAIRLENRGVTGLSVGLPKAVKVAALKNGSGNFKSKRPAKDYLKDNVAHSSNKGIKNYPQYTPKGGVLVEGMTVFKSHTGIFTKNGYRYARNSPYFEDGRDGRTSQRYTIRGAVLIGCTTALRTINNPTKQHTEKSVIAATPPASLYPEAAADAYTGKEWQSKYQIGTEGKHLPGGVSAWSITVDDETMAIAKANGFQTREELEARRVGFNGYGTPRGKSKFIGNVNKFYQRRLCGSRGKVGPSCHRPAFVFPKPAPKASEEVEDIELEMADMN
jgi:hypothetical protein